MAAHPVTKILKRKAKARYRTETSGKFLIELKLRSPRQLFDARDPAPFLERDIDDDAVDYILSAVQEFPVKTPLKVVIHFSEWTEEFGSPAEIREAIWGFFSYQADLLEKKLKHWFRQGIPQLLAGFAFLVGCLTIASHIGVNATGGIRHSMQEGLTIIGWVAMWRPVDRVLYVWWPMVSKKQTFQRLARIEIKINTEINKS